MTAIAHFTNYRFHLPNNDSLKAEKLPFPTVYSMPIYRAILYTVGKLLV